MSPQLFSLQEERNPLGTSSARTRETCSVEGFAYKDGGRHPVQGPSWCSKFVLPIGLSWYPEIQRFLKASQSSHLLQGWELFQIPIQNYKVKFVTLFRPGKGRVRIEAIRNDIHGEVRRRVLNCIDNSKDPGSTSKKDNVLEGKWNSSGLITSVFNLLIYSSKS